MLGEEPEPPEPCHNNPLGKDSSGKPAKAGKAKRGSSRGTIQCRGCKNSFDADKASTDSVYCTFCKRMLDRLARLASKEGPDAVALVSEARRDPKKVQPLLKRFLEAVNEQKPAKAGCCQRACAARSGNALGHQV